MMVVGRVETTAGAGAGVGATVGAGATARTGACCLASEDTVGAKRDEVGRGAMICVVRVGLVDPGREEIELGFVDGARDETLDIRWLESDLVESDLGIPERTVEVRFLNEGMGGRDEEDAAAFAGVEAGTAARRDGWNVVDGGGGGAILADFEPPPKNFLEPDTILFGATLGGTRAAGSACVMEAATFSFSFARSDDSFGIELDLGIEVEAFKFDVTEADALRLLDVDADRGKNEATPLRIASTPE